MKTRRSGCMQETFVPLLVQAEGLIHYSRTGSTRPAAAYEVMKDMYDAVTT